MASLNEVSEALANTIQNYCVLDADGSKLAVYATPADMQLFPGIMVEPELGDYEVSMGDDTTWNFRVYVLCSMSGSTNAGMVQLNNIIDGWGPSSIRQIVKEHGELGLRDTTAFVKGVSGYSGAFEAAGENAIGAILAVQVTTDSRQQGAQQ